MRAAGALVIASLMFCITPTEGIAQERLKLPSARLAVDTPDAVSAKSWFTVSDVEPPAAAAARLAEDFYRRLRPLEQRLRDDSRIRSAGVTIGLGAIAFGALGGQRSLTFAGTQALRFALDRQLTQVRHRSRLVLAPTIGHRAFAMTASRTFD
jgi:hypothetical protein